MSGERVRGIEGKQSNQNQYKPASNDSRNTSLQVKMEGGKGIVFIYSKLEAIFVAVLRELCKIKADLFRVMT